MQQADYNFTSHWHIPASKKIVSDVIIRAEEWQKWWDGLEKVTIDSHKHNGVGSVYTCTWRSASGYKLTATITVTEYLAGERICFNADGDLQGSGRFIMKESGTDATDITIYWNVSSTKKWMNRLSFILRPLFIVNHHALMAKGERGLAKYVIHRSS